MKIETFSPAIQTDCFYFDKIPMKIDWKTTLHFAHLQASYTFLFFFIE